MYSMHVLVSEFMYEKLRYSGQNRPVDLAASYIVIVQ